MVHAISRWRTCAHSSPLPLTAVIHRRRPLARRSRAINRDGGTRLSAAELTPVLAAVGLALPPDRVRAIVDRLDDSGDGACAPPPGRRPHHALCGGVYSWLK